MKDIILIAVLMFLYIIVFSMKGNYITYKPLQPQTIFDFETQQNTSFSEKPLFSYLSQQVDLPTYKIYSELYLPEKFIAELTKAKSQADYILVSEKILEQKFVFVKQTQLSHSEQRAQHKILSKNTTKKETKEAKNVEKIEVELETQTIQNIPESTKELNYVSIKDFVSKNQKTYFYPAVSVGKDVVVSIVSYTPYSAEEGILKFKITNNQKSFFFINLFQIETETNQKLPIRVFSEQFVSPEQQIEGYILFPIVAKNYNFLVSDGKNICRLNFKIP